MAVGMFTKYETKMYINFVQDMATNLLFSDSFCSTATLYSSAMKIKSPFQYFVFDIPLQYPPCGNKPEHVR